MNDALPMATLEGGMFRRFGLRLAACYFLIYNAARLFRLIPLLGGYSYLVDLAWRNAVLWTERVLLRMPEPSPIRVSGSADTSFLWVQNACMLSLALAVALVWTGFDRRRRWDPLVREIVRIGVRYSLAYSLINYGLAKLIPPIQFPAPWAGKLLEPVGRLSPMGLLWTFMGASRAYTAFSGIMELLGGLLLLIRRTTPLGALVSAGVVLNIVLLNFCYDVPVKLFSLNLLLMAGFLLWPDLPRLARVLVFNQPAPAAVLAPPWKARRYGRAGVLLKAVILCSLGYTELHRGGGIEVRDPSSSLLKLEGMWAVDEYTSDEAAVARSLTNTGRWDLAIFERSRGGLMFYAFNIEHSIVAGGQVSSESTDTKLILLAEKKGDPAFILALDEGQPGHLGISGTLFGHPIKVKLSRAEPMETRLLNRGFHWVSETPFNR